MEAKKFKVIIVEDVKLELKGTEEIFRHETGRIICYKCCKLGTLKLHTMKITT